MNSKQFPDISYFLFLSFLYMFCVSAKNNVYPNSRGNILRKKISDSKDFHEMNFSVKNPSRYLSNFQPGDDDKITETESNPFAPYLSEGPIEDVTCDCGYYSRNCTKDVNGTVICECATGYSQVADSCKDADPVDIREFIVIGAVGGTLLIVVIIGALLKVRSAKKKSQNYNVEASISGGTPKNMLRMEDNPIHRGENPPIQPRTSRKGCTRDAVTELDTVTSSPKTHQPKDYEVPQQCYLYIVRPDTSGNRKQVTYESKDKRNRLHSGSRSNLETVHDEENDDSAKPGYSGVINNARYESD